MDEWKGPFRCEKCGLVYPNAISNLNKGKCQLYCGSALVPWDRRAPDPRVDALVKAAEEAVNILRSLGSAEELKLERALAAMKEDADG